jgi:Skp family chaperone for outer membrane proteins
MKQLIIFSLFLCLPAFAGSIKYVDTKAVFMGTDEGRQVLTALQRDYQEKQNDIRIKINLLEARISEFQKNKSKMTKESSDELEQVLTDKYSELKKTADRYWKELNDRKNAAYRDFQQKFAYVIIELILAKKADFILEKDSLVYRPADGDMTEEVIQAYNRKYPVEVK